MNDETEYEHGKPTRRLATQAGCSHWAPIVPVAADAPDRESERAVTANLAESAAPPVEEKSD